jgi:hypothetical protein
MPQRLVYKFPLTIADEQSIEVPSGSDFMSVATQGDTLVAYFAVDPQQMEPAERRFLIRGTGMPVPQEAEDEPDRWLFEGSFDMAGGALMWHVWVEV